MAWERFEKGWYPNPSAGPEGDSSFQGTFVVRESGGPPRYYVHLNKPLLHAIKTSYVELWFDPIRFALALAPATAESTSTYRLSKSTRGVSLSRISEHYGFRHIFDGRHITCHREGRLFVFDLIAWKRT